MEKDYRTAENVAWDIISGKQKNLDEGNNLEQLDEGKLGANFSARSDTHLTNIKRDWKNAFGKFNENKLSYLIEGFIVKLDKLVDETEAELEK